ncbi:MAG TPA: c-type cytochrome [Verrucomicrobiae bacterium]|jgi:mono/diheme cytochrome c family protein|nr:c-type cytochrome [Verrucomicrobiae bacterium]
MNLIRKTTLVAAVALPLAGLLLAAISPEKADAERIERGRYLVTYGGCSDCHTPLKMTEAGPVPDLSRFLSGHPHETKLPPPDLKPGPWFAATAGMTAWAGPWGISYAPNLTPDTKTGLGIWTEEMFLKAMRTGKHMGVGRDILPPMPWRSVGSLNDEDLKAIFAYLKTVPPINNAVPHPVPPGGAPEFE